MDYDPQAAGVEDHLLLKVARVQLEHFTGSDPSCRALQLPEGVMLRYTMCRSLFFYLKTGIKDGKIATRIFASDSPYDRQKANIGEVLTPMFEARAEMTHLKKIERLVHEWVEFVRENMDDDTKFRSFAMDETPAE
jgi:hypothetical protein